MRLTVETRVIDRPTSADISAAVPPRAPGADWSLELESGTGTSIEAAAAPSGLYSVASVVKGVLYDADREVDGRELADMLLKFHAGDASWRKQLRWKASDGKAAPSAPPRAIAGNSSPGLWITLGLCGLAVAYYLARILGFRPPGITLPSSPLPAWLDTVPVRVAFAVFALGLAIMLVAIGAKVLEVRRLARWPRVMGRIVRSNARLPIGTAGRGTTFRPGALDIAYDYEIAGKRYEGTRVTISERLAAAEARALLARYPEGKVVPVFYDPANPTQATLERDMPKGGIFGCLGFLVVGAGAVLLLMGGATRVPQLISAQFPNAKVPLVLLLGLAAAATLVAAIVILRSATRARAWPTTTGTITASRVASFDAARDRSRGSLTFGARHGAAFMAGIEYTYSVGGRDYTARSVRHDTEVGGSRGFAERRAAAYPVGRSVLVRYDPADPQRAALEVHTGIAWMLLALALALLLGAALAAGIFSPPPR